MSISNKQQDAAATNTLPVEPLTGVDARRAETEAIIRTQDTSPEVIESRRRGRIEAETHRISEEVTRQAQERVRQERMQREQQTESTGGAEHEVMQRAGETNAPSRILPEPAKIERVLVPLDGSSYAERALPYSIALAAHTNASIVLAHVFESDRARGRNVLTRLVDPATGEELVRGPETIDAYLDTWREQASTTVTHIETAVLSADTASDGLVALLARSAADMVVLATHARQGLERRIIGSVGDNLIHYTHVPLLLIPPGVDTPDAQRPFFRRILVPLDGSRAAEEALGPVLALAKSPALGDHHRMDIVLYHVVESRVTRPEGVRYVEDVRERIVRTGLPDTITVTAAAMIGSPPGSITSAAIHGVVSEPTYPERFDLVAMATHGRSGFQRWLYGSVAAYLLAHLSVPILLVHPEQADG